MSENEFINTSHQYDYSLLVSSMFKVLQRMFRRLEIVGTRGVYFKISSKV
jgi:hypothetical protein